ncbi:DNA repair protein RecN [uncultured Robinsoniella sp.]|uniref:DNA repair protein RecN n=1 Tax=uncultured Robinsoniella sp. TaxID=904190 RepID=UPI00374EBD61
MLLNLHVKNMALIQELEVDFRKGLNILTGETGAGKSIIIGSVNVALGLKSFKEFAREDADYALAELVFSVEKENQKKQILDMEIPIEDDQVIISRKLMNGRSITKVNGETVPVSVVKELAEILIDIHGQHEHQSLLNKKNHLQILDEFAKEELAKYKDKGTALFKKYTKIRHQLSETRMDEAQKAKEMDFLQFEVDEIQEAKLKVGEDEELELQFKKLSNGKKIIEYITEIHDLCGNDSMSGAAENLGRSLRNLSVVAEYDKELLGLYNQLADVESLLSDFNRELSAYMGGISFDGEDFAKIEDRLDFINHLKSKCGNSIEEILAYQAEKEKRLSELQDYDAYMGRLNGEFEACKAELDKNAAKMSAIRKSYGKRLAKTIRDALVDLNFLEVQFEIAVEQTGQADANGYDEVCFMISTNPGENVKPLGSVASGGELSRIMLAIKTVLADKDATDTLIFDEIDVGISGRTAQKVSEKLAVIARNHQVICITHLAQIASMSDSHYVIEKKIVKNSTVTSIRELTETESIHEIARILGGAKITDTVMKSAKEMKELAVCTKKY